ncbi:MAG: hypothetical protein M9945_14130 [Aquamicrobium sp.]|uniref:hypothetical protein n=1 Tax=Aquamicrobium sp. TaxID=1872579 RepID=UPI00349EA461|nr:hypothetical protein [Aquamicrobium sp.]
MSYTTRMYALADALGMAIDSDGADGKITGARIKKWRLPGVTFEFGQKVVSSGMIDDLIGVIAKIAGNLAIFATVDEQDAVEVHILDLAMLPKVQSWLEDVKPASREDCLSKLGSAVVASFRKVGKQGWKPVP